MSVSVRPVEGQEFTLLASEVTSGLGRHPLFNRGVYFQGVTLIVNGSQVSAAVEPVDALVSSADVAYVGGCEYRLDAAAAQVIYDAGFGKYLTLVVS